MNLFDRAVQNHEFLPKVCERKGRVAGQNVQFPIFPEI